MVEYWSGRRHQAVESSRNAASAEMRDLYLSVAEHFRSLEEWCSVPRRGAALASRPIMRTAADG